MNKFKNALISFILFFGHLLPDFLAVKLGCFIGFLLRLFNFRRKLIEENIQLVYGNLQKDVPTDLVQRVYRHFGLLCIEMFRVPTISKEKFHRYFTYHGLDNLDNALALKQGIMSINGHLGNWEYTMSGITIKGYDVRPVVKAMKNVDNEHVYELLRGRKGVTSIPKRNSIKPIFKALKANASIGFVVDQNASTKEGVFVDFFGKKASTYSALYVLAKKTGATLVPVYSWRDEDLLHHHIKILPAIELEEISDDPQENLRHNTQRFVHIIEEAILEHPEQWIWMHRRWKHQPPSEDKE